MTFRHTLLAAAVLAAHTTIAGAQAPLPNVAASGRATTQVAFGNVRTPTATITIDYGQPHARGRQVLGTLIPTKGDSVWRLGANTSTSLVSTTDLMIGGKHVPKGTYTLFLQATPASAELIVNKQTGQWGTVYDKAQDLVRIPLRARTLPEPRESLVITLVPKLNTTTGTLVIAWGGVEYTADWMAH
jgi:hypothetical protein